MAWFLTNGKKTKKKTTKRGKSAGPAWDPQRTLLGVKFAGAVGIVVALALAWLFEPNPWVRLLLLITLPTLGNPVLAIWCVSRWQHLKRMAAQRDFD